VADHGQLPWSAWEPGQGTATGPNREDRNAMTDPTAPRAGAGTLPPQSPNSSAPLPAPAPPAPRRGRLRTRISGLHVGLIAATAALILVLIFIIQNAHAVQISFLGAHLRLSLAVALFFAAIAGALIMAAAGSARITQLRRVIRRDRRKPETD
jgi:lipopolysaccharide assembly protein A